MKYIILVVLAVELILAQQPSPPTWPAAFASTVIANGNQQRGPRFFRWFFDSTNQVERFDGIREFAGSMYFIEDIRDYATTTNYLIAFQMDEVSCWTNPTNGSMNIPDFNNFDWVGYSLVDYRKCNHWVYRNRHDGFFAQIWDDATSRDLVRIEVATFEYGSETWDFLELDAGAQDQSLFVVPAAIAGICTPFNP